MTKKRKAELCDAVILKFYGDKSFFWRDLHGDNYKFNDLVKDSDLKKDKSKIAKYFIIQPIINFLLGEGILKRMDNDTLDPYLSLTDKGNAILGDLKNSGYATKEKNERKDDWWKVLLRYIAIVTLILVSYRFIVDFVLPKFKSQVPTVQTLKDTLPTVTPKKIIQLPTDTVPKQQLQKKKP